MVSFGQTRVATVTSKGERGRSFSRIRRQNYNCATPRRMTYDMLRHAGCRLSLENCTRTLQLVGDDDFLRVAL